MNNETITMTKPRSPHLIQFSPAEDNHFFDVRIIKRATGEVKGSHYILTSDVPTWISYYEGDGFKQVEGAK